MPPGSSWSQVVQGGRRPPNKPPTRPQPRLLADRKGVLALRIPASLRVSVHDIAKVLAKDHRDLVGHVQPVAENDTIILQTDCCTTCQDHIGLKSLIDPAAGLVVKDIKIQVEPMSSSSDDGCAELLLTGVLFPEKVKTVDAVKHALRDLGTVNAFSPQTYDGTSISTGNVNILVTFNKPLKDVKLVNEIRIDYGDFVKPAMVKLIQAQDAYCYYCKAFGHRRAECEVAGACSNCQELGHPHFHCRKPAVPKPPAPPQPPRQQSGNQPTQQLNAQAGNKDPAPPAPTTIYDLGDSQQTSVPLRVAVQVWDALNNPATGGIVNSEETPAPDFMDKVEPFRERYILNRMSSVLKSAGWRLYLDADANEAHNRLALNAMRCFRRDFGDDHVLRLLWDGNELVDRFYAEFPRYLRSTRPAFDKIATELQAPPPPPGNQNGDDGMDGMIYD